MILHLATRQPLLDPLLVELGREDGEVWPAVPKLRRTRHPERRPKRGSRRPVDALTNHRGRLADLVGSAEEVVADLGSEELPGPLVPLALATLDTVSRSDDLHAVEMREQVARSLLLEKIRFALLELLQVRDPLLEWRGPVRSRYVLLGDWLARLQESLLPYGRSRRRPHALTRRRQVAAPDHAGRA